VNGDHKYGGEKSSVGERRKLNKLLDDFFDVENSDKCKRSNVIEMDGGEKGLNREEGEEEKEGGRGQEEKEVEEEESSSEGVSSLVEVITSILRSEDVLDRVRRFQTLDLLDVEGIHYHILSLHN
jgi:Inositol-pentakisphosphate 2-kinase